LLHQFTGNTKRGWVTDQYFGIDKYWGTYSRFTNSKIPKLNAPKVKQDLSQPEIIQRLLFRHLSILSCKEGFIFLSIETSFKKSSISWALNAHRVESVEAW
jgi:hypothetical protein